MKKLLAVLMLVVSAQSFGLISTAQKYRLNNNAGKTARDVQLGTLIENAESLAGPSLASGKIILGNSSNVAAAVTPSGDVTISNSGVTAIGSGVVVNADVSASAAIDFSKLAPLSSGNILVGNGSNVATSVAVSGDVTISNAGVTAIGSNKVLNSMMDSSVLKYVDVNLSAGQLDALNATPITAISAPAAGYVNVVDKAVCFIDFVAVANECGSCVLSFRYTDGSGTKATADVPNATFESGSDSHYVAIGASGVPVVAADIVAHVDADVTAGDTIVNCRLWYSTIQVSDI